jgi:cyclic pyranopterin phosphate synthase
MTEEYLTEILHQLQKSQRETSQQFQDYHLDRTSFCVMPFTTIILEPDGNIGVCRHKGSKYTFGNLRHNTLDEIWESEKIQEWRNDFKLGKKVICKTELTDRHCNQCPELNKLLPFAEIENSINPKIIRLTANLNGKCNLKCHMCDVWQLPNGFYTEENFWKPARERFFKEIKEVDLLSGEPFIQSDTYKLIDEISSVNPNCSWTFTTNLHWQLTDIIKSKLDQIKIKNFIISIDSLDVQTYKKIRYPGDLNFVLKNLDNLLKYQELRISKEMSSLNIRLNFLLQSDNWQEAQSIIRFCLKRKIIPFITFLYEPSELSLLTFDYNKRIEVLDFYFNNYSKNDLLFMQRIIKPLIRSLTKIDYIYYLELLK